MADITAALRQILAQALSDGPLRGSQLRQTVSREFERQTGRNFDDLRCSYPKFVDLLRAFSDLVVVPDHRGPGDVFISLKESPADIVPAVQHEERTSLPNDEVGSRLRIPRELWNAFTNPDLKRIRFFDRSARRVLHYSDPPASPIEESAKREVTSSSSDRYAQIDYALPNEQSAWMHEFIESVDLPGTVGVVASQLADGPYSSAVNAAFAASLGEALGADWRRFRASKVEQKIEEWARRRSVPLEDVVATRLRELGTRFQTDARQRPRHQDLRTALLNLTDDELDLVLIPGALVARLLRTHR